MYSILFLWLQVFSLVLLLHLLHWVSAAGTAKLYWICPFILFYFLQMIIRGNLFVEIPLLGVVRILNLVTFIAHSCTHIWCMLWVSDWICSLINKAATVLSLYWYVTIKKPVTHQECVLRKWKFTEHWTCNGQWMCFEFIEKRMKMIGFWLFLFILFPTSIHNCYWILIQGCSHFTATYICS